MACVSTKMAETCRSLGSYPGLPWSPWLCWGQWFVFAVTQDSIKSSTAAQDGISLQLPDPEDPRDFLMEQELGKIHLLWPGKVGQATQKCPEPFRLVRHGAVLDHVSVIILQVEFSVPLCLLWRP